MLQRTRNRLTRSIAMPRVRRRKELTSMATTPETPKSIPSTPSAAPQPPFASFDPYAMWQQGQQTFPKLMTDSVARWQSFADQYAAIEQQVSSHAQTAV